VDYRAKTHYPFPNPLSPEALKEMGYQIEAQPEAAPLNCCYSDQEAKARPFSSGRIHCPAPSLNFHGTEFA
jgi:hypothetical protein